MTERLTLPLSSSQVIDLGLTYFPKRKKKQKMSSIDSLVSLQFHPICLCPQAITRLTVLEDRVVGPHGHREMILGAPAKS